MTSNDDNFVDPFEEKTKGDIDKLDPDSTKISVVNKSTANKILQQCLFYRVNAVPIKGMDMKYASFDNTEMIYCQYTEDFSGYNPSWSCLKPLFYVLSKLQHNTDLLKPRSILDIGCGIGILGLFLRKLFQRCICKIDLIDYECTLLQLCKFNVNYNNLGDRISIFNFDIQDKLNAKEALGGNQSLILLSDFIISSKLAIAAANCILTLLDRNGCAIISHSLCHSILVSKYSTMKQEHSPQDDAIDHFFDFLKKEKFQKEILFQPENGDNFVAIVSRNKQVIDIQSKNLKDKLNEGMNYESVSGAEQEKVEIKLSREQKVGDQIDYTELLFSSLER